MSASEAMPPWAESPGDRVTPPAVTYSPFHYLVVKVRNALADYEASGDHKHDGGPVPGDCIACALRVALPKVSP